MSLAIEDFENICGETCPVFRAINYNDEAKAASGLCDGEKESYHQAMIGAAQTLDRAAGSIGCMHLTKELPNLEEEVPPLTDSARLGFVSQCPAHERYLELKRVR